MNLLTTLLNTNPAVQTLSTGQGKIVTSYLQDEAFLMAGAFQLSKKTYIVVKSNLYEAQQYYNTLKQLLLDDVCYFPFDESVRMEILAQSPEMLAERLNTYEKLLSDRPVVVVTHTGAVLRHVPNRETYLRFCLNLRVGQQFDMRDLQRRLVEMGYQYILNVDQPFYFSHRGGIIDVFSNNYEHPIRIEFFDDEIDSIRFFDEATQRTIETAQNVRIIPATELLYQEDEIPLAIELIEKKYQQCVKLLDTDRRDDLRHYLNIDLENLRHHDTTLSMSKYYSCFKHDTTLSANTISYHNCHRRCQAQRTRTADY